MHLVLVKPYILNNKQQEKDNVFHLTWHKQEVNCNFYSSTEKFLTV